jgi:hypothetical protein
MFACSLSAGYPRLSTKKYHNLPYLSCDLVTCLSSVLRKRQSQLSLVSVLYIIIQDNAIVNRRKLEINVIHGQCLLRPPAPGDPSHSAFLELGGS